MPIFADYQNRHFCFSDGTGFCIPVLWIRQPRLSYIPQKHGRGEDFMIRRKAFLRYLFSYLIVLILPIMVISYFIYFQFIREFEAEVMSSTTKVLQQTKDTADDYLDSLERLTVHLTENRHISCLLSRDRVGSLSPYPYFTNAVKELSKYKNANPIIQNIFLIFPDQDVVIGDSGKYDLFTFHNSVFRVQDADNPEFKKLIRKGNGKNVASFHRVIYNKRKTDVICYIQALPIQGVSPKAALVLVADQRDFKQPMKTLLEKYHGYTCVLDETGIIMSHAFSQDPLSGKEKAAFLSAVEDPKKDRDSISKDGYIVSFVRSEDNGWNYVSIIPSEKVLSRVNAIQQQMVRIIQLTLLCGILIILYLSGKDYRNIDRILHSIQYYEKDSAPGAQQAEYSSEWEWIHRTIVNYVEKNRNLQERIVQQMPVIRNSFFRKLIHGGIPDEKSIEEMLRFMGLELDKKYYGVLILAVDHPEMPHFKDAQSGHRSEKSGKSEPIREVLQTAMADLIQNAVEKENFVYVLEDQEHTVDIVIGMDPPGHGTPSDSLREAAVHIRQAVKKDLGFTVTIGVGGLCPDLIRLSDSYQEAADALEYRILMGENSIIRYDEISDRREKRISYSFQQERDLVNYIKTGEYEEIQQVLDEVVSILKSKPYDLPSIQYVYYDIVHTAVKAADEINIGNADVETFLEELSRMGTLDQIYRSVSAFYKRLCTQIREARLSKNTELASEVAEYIKKNYSDSMLSVAGIADRFSISPSYLSRYMKDYLGCSVTDYIHQTRIQQAKFLLNHTDQTVAVIAEGVGYNSLQNFSRVFKRYEGITPTNYRIPHRAAGSNSL